MAKEEKKQAEPVTLTLDEVVKMFETLKAIPFKARIALVRTKIQYIEKRGEHPSQHYKYAQAGDIQGTVGIILAEHGIIFGKRNQKIEWSTLVNSKNYNENLCRLEAEFGLIDAFSDESLWIPAFGEGRDGGDKAYYKASTGLRKYALIDLLMLGIGDDPEASENGGDETPRGQRRQERQPEEPLVMITEEQAKELSALCQETHTDLVAMVNYFKAPQLEFVPFDAAKQILESKRAKMTGEKKE